MWRVPDPVAEGLEMTDLNRISVPRPRHDVARTTGAIPAPAPIRKAVP